LAGSTRLIRLLSIIVLIIVSMYSFAAGQKENKLAQAKQLYSEKYYDKALILLAEIVREDPDRRDAAIEISNKIIKIREEYNTLYEKLIDTLYNKLDVDTSLVIIEQMKKLDPYPNEKTKVTVEIAEDAAIVVANKNYFESIMEEALAQVRENNYFDAVKTYLKGFDAPKPLDLHRSEFDAEAFDTITEADIASVLALIPETSEAFIQIGKDTEIIDEIITTGQIPSFSPILDNFMVISGQAASVQEAAEKLQFQADRLRERVKTAKSILHLKYLYQLTNGREANTGYEGILYAIKTMVQRQGLELQNMYRKKSEYYLTEGKAAFDEGDYSRARTNYSNAVVMSIPVLPFAYFLDTGEKLPPGFTMTTFSNWLIEESLPSFMDAQEDAKTTFAYLYILDYQESLNTFFPEVGTVTEESLRRFTGEIDRNTDGIQKCAEHWESYVKQREEKTPLQFNVTKASIVISLCAKTISSFVQKQVQQLYSFFNLQKGDFPQEKELLETGEPHEEFERVYYPDRRLSVFKRILSALSFIDTSLDDVIIRWSEGGEILISQADLEETVSDAERLKSEIAVFRKEVDVQVKIAEANILEAKKYRDIGNRRYNETMKAIDRDAFTIVEEKIREAANAYDTSLDYQEDAEVRRKRLELVQLQKDIIGDIDRIVKREVDRLIQKGIDLYAKALYEDSLETFLTAEDRWNDTHTEKDENPVIKVWLGFVREALSIESERVISEKHPLYKEMMQLYNLAKQDYNEGVKLKKEGKTVDAIIIFQRAEEKLLKIKQQFPYNNDANILKLLCTKERNEEEYMQTLLLIKTNAQTQLNDIRRKKASAAAKAEITKEQRDAYNNLKDLVSVETKNSELKKLVTDFENELLPGKAPISEEKKRLSREKTEEARWYFKNKPSGYDKIAKALLLEAIELDPSNNEAKELYNKEISPEKDWIFSYADKKKYDKALQLVINGNYLLAKTIVDDLLKKYRGSDDLIKLDRRIKVALGEI
jgi:hypothetical protein